MAMDIKEAAKKAGVPEDEMARALELLSKEKVRKAKIASGELKTGRKYSELKPEEKLKLRKADERRRTKNALIIAKATAQGIAVSEAEIDAAIAKAKK